VPLPLNSASAYVDDSKIVLLSARDYNRLFSVWEALGLGKLEVVYADKGLSGFAIPADLSGRIQLVLPAPVMGQGGGIDPAKLSTETLEVCLAGGGTKIVTFVTFS
jgi:hypothetical protein